MLLGYVFSCYKDTKYTWTDSVQSPHVLAEATLNKMVGTMCAGKMTTDYLSAGSITWQNFSEYLGKIFGLTEAQLAEQVTGYHNVREAVTMSGAPFWVLKHLPESIWPSADLQTTAEKVIDNIQTFIAQEGDIEGAMSNVLQLMQGRGKIRVVLAKVFQDKNAMAAAFRTFLFEASPALKDIAERLSIQPEELNDKLHSVMQGAIYTWTEDQVKEKLADVTEDYKYIEAIGKVQGTIYHSIEAVGKDLANQFKFLRISLSAIEQLNKPWYPALKILHRVSKSGNAHLEASDREQEISTLEQYGVFAKDCLVDGKPILADILTARNIDFTTEELASVYDGLKHLNCEATLTQFNKELDSQINKVSYARNKVILKETWHSISGKDSVKGWCKDYKVPLLWIVPKESQGAFRTLIDVQKNNYSHNTAVVSAINTLKSMDVAFLTNQQKVEEAFLKLIGPEFQKLWNEVREEVIAEAKQQIGNDMSDWNVADLTTLQKILKKKQQEKAKKEKLAGAKSAVRSMNENKLRDRVERFLDAHPEFCDDLTA